MQEAVPCHGLCGGLGLAVRDRCAAIFQIRLEDKKLGSVLIWALLLTGPLICWDGNKGDRPGVHGNDHPEAILRRVLLPKLIPINSTYQNEAYSGLQFIESHRGAHDTEVIMASTRVQNKAGFPTSLVSIGYDFAGLIPRIPDRYWKLAGARRNQVWQHQTFQSNGRPEVFFKEMLAET